MVYMTITSLIFILSLAYVVLALANKESGNMKLAGQILAALIILIALVVLVFGAMGKGGCPMCGKGMMGGKGMMMEGKSGMCGSGDMMKNKDMGKMMMKKTAK